jgi:hypothetical protein
MEVLRGASSSATLFLSVLFARVHASDTRKLGPAFSVRLRERRAGCRAYSDATFVGGRFFAVFGAGLAAGAELATVAGGLIGYTTGFLSGVEHC